MILRESLLEGENLKKLVTAIILVTLILSLFVAQSTPHVKAQTSNVVILSYSWYTAPLNTILAESSGDLVVVGEIQNTGTTTIGSVFIYGVAYNSTEAVCAVNDPVQAVPDMLPGQKAPFYLDFTAEGSLTHDQSWVSSVTNVTLSVATVLNSTETPYTGLTIPTASVHGFDDSGTYTVTGAVVNNGDQATGNIWVLTTFYNSSGKVIGFNCTSYLTSSLGPNKEVSFDVTPSDNTEQLSSEVANYSLLVESSLITSSTPTASPSHSITQQSPTATPPQTAKNSVSTTPTLTYAIVVGVVLIAALFAVLMLLRNHQKTSKFEALLPPPLPPPT